MRESRVRGTEGHMGTAGASVAPGCRKATAAPPPARRVPRGLRALVAARTAVQAFGAGALALAGSAAEGAVAALLPVLTALRALATLATLPAAREPPAAPPPGRAPR